MSKKTVLEIVKIVTTAIVAIASVLLVQSCTASLSVVRNSSDVQQSTHQKASADSTNVSPSIQF